MAKKESLRGKALRVFKANPRMDQETLFEIILIDAIEEYKTLAEANYNANRILRETLKKVRTGKSLPRTGTTESMYFPYDSKEPAVVGFSLEGFLLTPESREHFRCNSDLTKVRLSIVPPPSSVIVTEQKVEDLWWVLLFLHNNGIQFRRLYLVLYWHHSTKRLRVEHYGGVIQKEGLQQFYLRDAKIAPILRKKFPGMEIVSK